MKTRLLTAVAIALVGIPILIFSHTVVFPIAVSLISVVVTFEILRVIGAHSNPYVSFPAYIIAVILPFGAYFYNDGIMTYVSILAVSLFIFLIYLFAFGIFTKGTIKFAKISENANEISLPFVATKSSSVPMKMEGVNTVFQVSPSVFLVLITARIYFTSSSGFTT